MALKVGYFKPRYAIILIGAQEIGYMKRICKRVFVMGIMGKTFRVLVLCLFVSMGLVVRGTCQEPEVLSLDQLIELAVERSPQLKESHQRVLAAEGDLMQARGGMLPRLEVVATVGPSQNADLPTVVVEQTSPGVFTGFLQDNDKDSVGIFGRLDLAIYQPIYTFGKISHRRDAAAQGVEAQKLGREARTSEVILNVKELYYSTIVARQGEGAARSAGDFIQDARNRIERMIAAGSPNVDESDLFRLEAFEAEVLRFRARAESGSRLAYQALKRAVGYPEDQNFRLDRRELPAVENSGLKSVEDYMRQALESRPELRQLEAGVKARESMLKAGRADLYPNFFAAAIGSFAGAPERDRMPISYFGDPFNHAYMGVIVGSEWSFDFGIKQGRLNKARAEYQEMLHKMEYARNNIPLQVMKYYEDIVEAEKSLNAYRKAVVAARRWVVASFANFDFGLGTAKDMFDAIDRYGKNEGEYLSSLLNYNVSKARLEHAVGLYGQGRTPVP